MSGIFDQVINYAPPSLLKGTVTYKGTWSAATNTPTLINPPDSTTNGFYYVVSAAGTQFSLVFNINDWIISNGSAWQKVDNTDSVDSVFGRTGAVVGVSTDYSSVGITATAVGASSPSTGAFTTLSSTSTTTLNSTTIPASKTLVVTTDKISVLAATTSAELAGVISDETGSGSLVFATLPTFGATGVKLSGSTSGTTTVLSGATAGTSVLTLPVATDTLVGKATTDTLTNKTLTSPTITTPVIAQINDASGNETLKLASIASAVNEVTIENAATGNAVHISATGGDASVGLHLAGKGASGYVNVQDSTDATKRIMFNAAGGTTNTRTMLSSTQTVDRTLSLPDATDTLVGRATTDTLTNKTITGGILNGTLGATTPSSVAATTGTFSSTLAVTGVATLGNGAILGTPASGTVTNLTGTASININGTVGATTPSTGAFTTVGASSSISGAVGAYFPSISPAPSGSNLEVGYDSGSNIGVLQAYNRTGSAWRAIGMYGLTSNHYASGSLIGSFSSTGLAVTGNLSTTTGANFATSSGNVGIGTASPGAPLTVQSDAVYNGEIGAIRLQTATDTNKRMFLGYDKNLNAGYIQSQQAGTNWMPTLINPNGGNVGIGTTSPATLLHTYGTTGIREQVFGAASLLGQYQAEGTAASPTASADGRQMGGFQAFGYNGSAYAIGGDINVQADGLWSVSNQGTYLRFRTTPNGSTSVAEVMRITGSGKVGIGTASPSAKLTVVSTTTPILSTFTSTLGGYDSYSTDDASGARFFACFNSAGSVIGSISRVTTTNAVAFNTTSDGRLKENLREFTDSGRLIDALKPRVFDWKNSDDNGKGVIGFIAQEEHAADPIFAHIGAVSVGDDDPDTITKQWQRSDAALIPILVAELQSLRKRLAVLESK